MSKTVPPGPPPVLDLDRCALFLDYDGTLVDLAPTPAEAVADAGLRELLATLQVRLTGALGIVTGRPVADIDGFLAPLRLTVAGLHGLVRRRHDGAIAEAPLPEGLLPPVREALARFVASHPGTMLEDKRLSLALHYRQAPEAAAAAGELAQALAAASDGLLRLQRGKMVEELLPAGFDKGGAVKALLEEPDFRGRLPIFVGDDVTDEAGFRSVNGLGGVSIRVGAGPTEATHQLGRRRDAAALAGPDGARLMPGRLYIVSNRVTPPTGRQAAGGLAVGVLSSLRDKGGVWFGWSGNLVDTAEERKFELYERGKISYALLDLTEAEHAGYYSGMANRTLWPLFHYRIDLTSFEHEWYHAYRDVARLFAEQLMQLLQPEDRVWVQDFHLIPLGTELRASGLHRPARLLPAHPVPADAALRHHALAPRAGDRPVRLRCGGLPDAERPRAFHRLCLSRAGRAAARRRLAARRRADDRGPCLPDRHRRQGGRAADRVGRGARASSRRMQRHPGRARADHRRRPARLQQGHPRTAARLSGPARALPRSIAARWC